MLLPYRGFLQQQAAGAARTAHKPPFIFDLGSMLTFDLSPGASVIISVKMLGWEAVNRDVLQVQGVALIVAAGGLRWEADACCWSLLLDTCGPGSETLALLVSAQQSRPPALV